MIVFHLVCDEEKCDQKAVIHGEVIHPSFHDGTFLVSQDGGVDLPEGWSFFWHYEEQKAKLQCPCHTQARYLKEDRG